MTVKSKKMDESISFTKEEMMDLLLDYSDALYNDNPYESVFTDNSQYVRDFVEGYFSEYFRLYIERKKDLTFCSLCETNKRKKDEYGWYCEECKEY